MALTLRVTNGFTSPFPILPSAGPLAFAHPGSDSFENIVTSFDVDGTSVATRGEIGTTELDSLGEFPPIPSGSVSDLLRRRLSELHKITRYSYELIVQELRLYEHPSLVAGREEWSVDGGVWHVVPMQIRFTGARLLPAYEFDQQWARHVGALLAAGDRPLLATRHLSDAMALKDPRFCWVQATTAAELGIKEALGRLEPVLETVLKELPSPPIHKLYGAVLQSVSGHASPYARDLQKGVEVRNRLVHRPDEPDPDLQKTADYVALVDRALRHLRHVCRSSNSRLILDDLHLHVRTERYGDAGSAMGETK